MKLSLVVIFAVLLAATPIFAANTLTIISSSNGTATFVNTRTNMTVFNVTVVADNQQASITAINVTLTGNATGGSISKIYVFNSSTSGTLLGVNSSIASSITSGFNMSVSFSTPLTMGANTNTSILVLFEISPSGTSGSTIGGNLTNTDGIASNITVIANVSLPNSTLATIRSFHTSATVSPNFVDTNVTNQPFVYTLKPTGTDGMDKVNISFPAGYTLADVTAAMLSGSDCIATVACTVLKAPNGFNITFQNNQTLELRVNFTANTSASPVSTSQITSTISGSDITGAIVDENNTGSTNVTTQQMLNLTTVKIIKSTAVINNTDYWEFNLTFIYTATLARGGIIQFKLSNWTDASGNSLVINNTNCPGNSTAGFRCATLRNGTGSAINLTNDYETTTKGITVLSTTQDTLITLILRMILPTGTPPSSTWQATYGALFRATP